MLIYITIVVSCLQRKESINTVKDIQFKIQIFVEFGFGEKIGQKISESINNKSYGYIKSFSVVPDEDMIYLGITLNPSSFKEAENRIDEVLNDISNSTPEISKSIDDSNKFFWSE